MMGRRPKEIVIRYSQKVPILVREAIAHTTRKFVRDRQDSRAMPPREEKVSPPRGPGDRCRIREEGGERWRDGGFGACKVKIRMKRRTKKFVRRE